MTNQELQQKILIIERALRAAQNNWNYYQGRMEETEAEVNALESSRQAMEDELKGVVMSPKDQPDFYKE